MNHSSDKPLRIGIIAPPWIPIPPTAYGGTELVIDGLCTGLKALGHDVTLFTTGDATCPVGRAFLFDHSDPDHMGSCVLELRHVAAAYDALDDLDIIHDHTLAGLFLSQMHHLPVVTTNHGPFDDDLNDLYRRVGRLVPIIAISHDQASHAPPDIPIAAVIHHGLDLNHYPFSAQGGDGLVFLGRMSPNKGVDDAIRSAQQVGRPLKIAAKMNEPGELRYFHDTIEPQLSTDIEFVGEVGLAGKVELLTNAAALINPIRWPEPFGLVMIEALASGTPVITNRIGAAPEIVDDCVTGKLADDFDDLVAGLEQVETFERSACRAAVEHRFTHLRMAKDHESFYRRVLEDSTNPPNRLIESSVGGPQR
jgi:glycosyltransferase involved in cell wall biosynthesis